MKCFRVLLALGATASWMALSAADSPSARPISLGDCIEMALAKNFDLRIERYRQEYSRIGIDSEFAAFDPRFTARVRQQFTKNEAIAQPGQLIPPSSENWNEQYRMGLVGLLPYGTTYDFSGFMLRRSGIEFSPLPNGNVVAKEGSFAYTPNAAVVLTQPLLRGFLNNQPRFNIAVQRNALKQDIESLRLQMIRVVTDVSIAYYDLIAAKENVKVQERAVELADRLVFERKRKVEIGTLAALDGQEAESQAASRRADLLSAQQTRRQAENRVKQLVNDNFASLDPVRFDPTASLDLEAQAISKPDSWTRALSQRPEIVRSRLDLERQKISLKFFKNQLFPQLDLEGSYGLTGADRHVGPSLGDISGQRNPNFYAGMSLSYPLNNRLARNNLKQARLQQEQLLLTFKKLEQDVMVEVANQVLAAETALERITATRQAEQFARAALGAEEGKLNAGKSTFFEILDKQSRLTRAEVEALNALTDYRKALERLSLSEGSTLDRQGIRIEVK